MKAIHNIPPVFDENSVILILGSFPSVKSREGRFFYNHPQNRFWRVLAELTGKETPLTVEQKREFLISSRIAVWDVVKSCDVVGSGDSTIKNVKPNDLGIVLDNAGIRDIFANGRTAAGLYDKYCYEKTRIKATVLPSTSPANAAFSFEKLCAAWSVIKKCLF